MKFIIHIIILIELLFCTLSSAEEVNVWAISDMYKIFPDNGDILETDDDERVKEKNEIWDSQQNKISLYGAKNEAIAFQIILEKKKTDVSDVSIVIADVSGPSAFDWTDQFNQYLVGYVKINQKYYPDILIPASIQSIYPFSIPHKIEGLSEIPTQSLQSVWIDLKIPRNIQPGDYNGKISVQANNRKIREINLVLKILDFEIPVERSFVVDINSYGSPIRDYPDFDASVPDKISDQALLCEKRYYALAHDHRACLNILPYHSQRGTLRYGPEITGTEKNVRVKNWAWFDKRFGAYLDGSAYEDGESNKVFYLPFNPCWPIMAKNPPDRYDPTQGVEFEETWKTLANEYSAHFNEKGWTNTEFQIYLNQKPQDNNKDFIAWNLDEPTHYEDYRALQYFCDLTHKAFDRSNQCNFKFRMDIGHYWCNIPSVRCYKAKQYDEKADEILSSIDTWYFNWNHAWGAVDKARELKAKGKETWIYNGAGEIEKPSTEIVGNFYAFSQGPWQGYCIWNQGNIDPSREGEDGNDHIWYNSKIFNYEGPLPSVRLKLWRRGQQDYEYLRLADKVNRKSGAIEKCIEEIVNYKTDPQSKYKYIKFPNVQSNPFRYVEIRLKLALIILNKI